MTMKHSMLAVSFAAGLLAAAGSASAQLVNLADLNSSADFDIGTQAGQHTWFVDNINHMFQQWFWYRADGDPSERSIDTLVPLGNFVSDTNPFTDPRPDTLAARWRDGAGGRFDIELNFTLRGGQAGSNRSDLAEQIRITNNTATVLPFHFFQYADFDLNGSITDATVQIHNGNTADQADGAFGVSETVVTPLPSHYEVNFYPATLNSLNDLGVTTLNDNPGPIGPGDLTWAFQWDFNLLPGQAIVISKDKSIVPTPGSATLLALGGLALARRRRR